MRGRKQSVSRWPPKVCLGWKARVLGQLSKSQAQQHEWNKPKAERRNAVFEMLLFVVL